MRALVSLISFNAHPHGMAPLKPGLCPLLTEEVIENLKRLGIRSVVDFVSEPAPQLCKRAGLPYKDVLSIRRSLLSQFSNYPVSAKQLWEEEGTRCMLVSTGCPSLDQLLNGGLITGQLTEVCGPPASGKTQLCLCVTGNVVMTTTSSVVYIDSGCSFSSTRLMEILVSKGLKDELVVGLLQRIKVYRVSNIFEVLGLLETLKKGIAEQIDSFHSNLRMVVLDPITFFISPLLGGRQFHGHGLMTQLSMAMKLLAYEHSVAVLYSNNVVVDFSGGGVAGGGVKPALGRTWTYVPSTRLMLCQQEHCLGEDGAMRIATVTKSSRLPTGIATKFLITGNGLESSQQTKPNTEYCTQQTL